MYALFYRIRMPINLSTNMDYVHFNSKKVAKYLIKLPIFLTKY